MEINFENNFEFSSEPKGTYVISHDPMGKIIEYIMSHSNNWKFWFKKIQVIFPSSTPKKRYNIALSAFLNLFCFGPMVSSGETTTIGKVAQ